VNRRSAIANRFNRVFPEFKEYAQRTKYERDLLDKESYLKLFKECDYTLSVSHPVDFGRTFGIAQPYFSMPRRPFPLGRWGG
jgi:hypothetical protein